MKVSSKVCSEVLAHLPARVREPLMKAADSVIPGLEEVRMRANQPLSLYVRSGEVGITPDGTLVRDLSESIPISRDDVEAVVQSVTGSSLYAVERELKRGFLSMRGGHRMGVVGVAVYGPEGIRTLKSISSVNIRVARQVLGAADRIIPRITEGGRLLNTLIISPPMAGKTTLLRDLIRQGSLGNPLTGLSPHKFGVVDERGELAACYDGVPQNDLGPRTDVLDGCAKAEGMGMLVRSMSPNVIATDEIGGTEDAEAITETQKAGVAVIATAHAATLEELARRSGLKAALERGTFSRYVILSRRNGPGTIEAVLSGYEAGIGAFAASTDRGVG